MGALTNTRVFLDESLSPQDKRHATDLVRQLDGEIVPVMEFDSCQVCIATEEINTTRYRMFIAVKIPVVSMSFILDCLHRNMFCPPFDYAITKIVKSPSRTKINDKQDIGVDDDEVVGAGASQELVDRSYAQYQLKQNFIMKMPKEVIPLPSFQIYVPPPITSPVDRRRSERVLERRDDDEVCDSVESICELQIFRTKSWPPEGEKDYVKRNGDIKTIKEKISKSTAALLGNEKRATPAPRARGILAVSTPTVISEMNEYIKPFLPNTIPDTNIIALPAETVRLRKEDYTPDDAEVIRPLQRVKGDKRPYFAFAVRSRQNEDIPINKSVLFRLFNKDNKRKPVTQTQGAPYPSSGGVNYFHAFNVVKPGNYVLEVTSTAGVAPFVHEFVVVSSTATSDSIQGNLFANQTISTAKRKYTKRNSVAVVENNVKKDDGMDVLFDNNRKDVGQDLRRSSPRSKQSRSSIVGSSILNTISQPPDSSSSEGFLSKAKVILTAFDVEEDKMELNRQIKKQTRIFRVFESRDVMAYDDITHVVVPASSKRGKTIAILMAIIKGIPIVTDKWMHACIESKAILPPTPNFLHKLYQHHLESTKTSTLLTGKQAFVLDRVTSTEMTVGYTSKQHIEMVIGAAGGIIVPQLQHANFIVCENYGDLYAFMSSSESTTNKNYLTSKPVFTFKYITECVAAIELIDSTEYCNTGASIMAEYDEEKGKIEKIATSPSRPGRVGTPDSPSFF